MKVIIKNASVNLHTGERFDRIVGNGESRLVSQCHDISHIRLGPRPETPEEQLERAKKISELLVSATNLFERRDNMSTGIISVQCKFHCQSVTKTMYRQGNGTEKPLYTAEFHAVTDGSEENKKFFEWTPSGSLKIGVYKEDLFQPGQDYYLDINNRAMAENE